MTVHVEWLNARSTSVTTTTKKGEFSDAYGSVNDGPALLLSCDSVFVIEGTREELAALAEEITAAVDALDEDDEDDEEEADNG